MKTTKWIIRVMGAAGVGALILLLVLSAGCTTSQSISADRVSAPIQGTDSFKERAVSKENREVQRLIDSGGAAEAIPRLQETLSRYYYAESAKEARYLLGLAYYQIRSYQDAIDAFNEYLRLAPDGPYAAESKQYVTKLSAEYDQRYLTAEKLDAAIADAKAKVDKEPAYATYQWELADLLWRRGNYPEAAQLYVAIATKEPLYAQDETFKRRVELLPNGQYVVLTPNETQRRQRNANPLVVFNENVFKAGRNLNYYPGNRFNDNTGDEPRYYGVSGQVVNQGDSVLYGVQVIVTLFGVGRVVYDTSAVGIGRLNPGEIRAFNVRFTTNQDIENIFNHECVATFER